MDKDPEFISRIREVVDMVGGQAALAEATGLSKSVISKYVNGHSEPDRKRLISIATEAQVSVGWLVDGSSKEQLRNIWKVKGGARDTRYFTIPFGLEQGEASKIYMLPFYENHMAPASKKDTLENNFWATESSVRDRLVLRKKMYPLSGDMLFNTLGANQANDLAAFIAHSDCMEPTIYSGDIMIVDLTKINLVDGIHLIANRGNIHFRRIYVPHNSEIELRCDNKKLYPESVKIADDQLDELEIVGRVIWHGRRM